MNTQTVEPAVPEVPIPEGVALVDGAERAYETEFNAMVAKKEGAREEPPAPVASEPKAEPAEKPEAVAAPVVVKDDDLISLLPEDKRDAARARFAAIEAAEKRAAKLENDNRSMAGRMSAYQRKYEEAAGKRPVEVVKQETAEQSAEWTQFKEDYPDIAKAIEARYTSSLPASSDEAMKSVVEYVEHEKRSRFLHDAWDAVEAVHAGWRDTGKTTEFQEWKSSSTTYEKLASSDDIADAIALFDLYDAHRSRAGTKTPDAAQTAAADKLAARRDAQVEGAKSTNNSAQQPNPDVDLNSPDQLFEFYAQKSNKRLQGRYH
jgi:seryl-tRNA synthetase